MDFSFLKNIYEGNLLLSNQTLRTFWLLPFGCRAKLLLKKKEGKKEKRRKESKKKR
jgi:hypothetical protein